MQGREAGQDKHAIYPDGRTQKREDSSWFYSLAADEIEDGILDSASEAAGPRDALIDPGSWFVKHEKNLDSRFVSSIS
jgi:hypothetical protein